ncbi:transposase [Atopobium sp. oral taxon 416]|uniref:transposase n=1 Tax=Atopobium sp. oral taxon 416 TaxID=712157 RepID=UPI002111FED7|nr:transposase [Atopobium sp. oral taxon 416]
MPRLRPSCSTTTSASEAALMTEMAEMAVAGVFTVKVGRVVEEVCERSFSKHSVFEAHAELDPAIRAFCDWPLKGE